MDVSAAQAKIAQLKQALEIGGKYKEEEKRVLENTISHLQNFVKKAVLPAHKDTDGLIKEANRLLPKIKKINLSALS